MATADGIALLTEIRGLLSSILDTQKEILAAQKETVRRLEIRKEEEETEWDGFFAEAWKHYPKRNGSNSRKGALKAYRARIRAGEASPEELHAAVLRYKRWCDENDKTGTELVMQGQRFFGPGGHYEEDWGAGKSLGNGNRYLTPADIDAWANG